MIPFAVIVKQELEQDGAQVLLAQPTPLGVGQPEAPTTELFTEDPVLLDQVLDHLLLAPIDPAGHGRDTEVEDEGVHARQGSAAGDSADRPSPSSTIPGGSASAQ